MNCLEPCARSAHLDRPGFFKDTRPLFLWELIKLTKGVIKDILL